MKSVLNNPYRTLGLLVGATAAEQRKQTTRLHRFIEAEQSPDDDFSFPLLGKLDRTIESINEASSKLNLDIDKITAALFWFYRGSEVFDEPVFDALKLGNLEVVTNIWERKTMTEEMSIKNASAFFNLATLYLSGIANGTKSNENLYSNAIKYKLLFIENGYYRKLMLLCTDENFRISQEILQHTFLNQLFTEIEISKTISTNKFIEIIQSIDFKGKENYLNTFIEKPIDFVESKIQEAKNNRKSNNVNGIKIGNNLMLQTSESLFLLQSILGISDFKFSSISDKIANEMLQCSIDYFNYYREVETDINYFDLSWKLTKSAEDIAIGRITKERIIDCQNTLIKLKDKEISQAIELLKSIKEVYETNKAKINAQVREMPLGYNQTINWTKVNDMIENSLDWNKVVELIMKTIPIENVDKIKSITNGITINEFKTLMDFIWNRLSYSQKNKIKYIYYWRNETTLSHLESFPTWLKWSLGVGVFLLIVSAIWGQDGLEVVLGIGIFIGIGILLDWLKNI